MHYFKKFKIFKKCKVIQIIFKILINNKIFLNIHTLYEEN